MFKGVDFIFNNVPSETYGLKIGFTNGGDPRDTISGVVRSIEEHKNKRQSKPHFLGLEITNKLEFDLIVYSETELDTYDRQAIDNWLYQNEYKYFSIVQKDFDGLYFKCIITESSKTEIGGVPYAKNIHVICDDSYAYTNEYTYTYTSTTATTNHKIRNLSNINDYLYVEDMKIVKNSLGSVSIKNLDENREFFISNVFDNETLNIDNNLKKIKSSLGRSVISNFNKKWLRFVPISNTIALQGNFTLTLKIRYRLTI